jgi:phosphonoacetate hydrolase
VNDRRSVLERASELVASDELDRVVDMVLSRVGPDSYVARSSEGLVRFEREGRGRSSRFAVCAVEGADPLANQGADAFSHLDEERCLPHPRRSANSYPLAFEQVAQLFDHPGAPDLCVVHSAAHNSDEASGHLGDHGSIGVVQARAPFVVSGAGIRALGEVPLSCRLVDVAPTMLRLLGAEPRPGADGTGQERRSGFLARQDGEALDEVLDEGRSAAHLVGILLDGCNSNVLLDMVERREVPNICRIVAKGTAYRYGAISSLPTVTLANHTTILTGCHPGHHGILNNAWFDRSTGRQVVTNAPQSWPTAMRWLDPRVETVFSAVKRCLPAASTAAVNEPCETGADYSTFDLVRRGTTPARPPGPDDLPDAHLELVGSSRDYRWSSRVDHSAVDQFEQLWGSGREVPTLTWVNFTLTDSAFHEGGPYSDIARASVEDCDARIGRILATIERSGRLDETAFVLVADHGMQATDPEVTGDWAGLLADAKIDYRDEAHGFIYLEESGA